MSKTTNLENFHFFVILSLIYMTVTYEPMNIMTSGNERAGEYMCECVCVCAYGCVCVCDAQEYVYFVRTYV